MTDKMTNITAPLFLRHALIVKMLVMRFLRYFCFFAIKCFTSVKQFFTLSFNGAQNAVKFKLL